MKKISTIIAISMIGLVLVLSGAYAGEMMTSEKSTAIHYATNLIGAKVNNLQNETLGKIIDLTIDQNRITFAVLSHGGMLGFGEKLIPVPIRALSIKDEKTVLLDISKEKLATAPSFDRNNRPDFSNRQWTEDTYRFYGVQPFWREGGKEEMMEKGTPMKEQMKESGMEKMMEKGAPMKEKMQDMMKPGY